ncbi:hypothetical protein NPIL_404361, partial [Nephila pilipes]
MDSAFRIVEKCPRPNKKFKSEEAIFQVIVDPDCWLMTILLAIAEVEKDTDLMSLWWKDCDLLKRRAIAFHQKTVVPQGPCGFEGIALFEQNIRIHVVVISTTASNQ